MTSKTMNQSALMFSAAVLLALLVLGACGPRVQAQARIPRNPAPTVQPGQSQPAATPTPWRPCENNRRTTPRNCNEDRRIHQPGDRSRVR